MFVVFVEYIKPLEVIDAHLAAHRQFLDEGYAKNAFLASGPQVPRTGGVILSALSDRAELEALLARDPFRLHEVATYKIIEFTPAKYHRDIAMLVEGSLP